MSAMVLAASESDKPPASPGAGPLPGARTALVLLLTINLFNYIDRQVLAAVEPAIEKDFFPHAEGDSIERGVRAVLQFLFPPTGNEPGKDPYAETLMGLLATAFMVSYMITAPLFGWLADRMSRWLLISVGVVLWSLASGATGWAPTFGLLLLTRCFVGIGEAAYGPAAPTVISDLYPVRVRGSVLAWFYVAIPVGSALGYVLGGQVASWTGNWRWAFFLVVPPGLLLGLWSYFMPEPPRGQADDAPAAARHRAGWKDYRVLLRTPSYVLNTLAMTATTFAIGGIGFWMPRYTSIVRHAGDLGKVNLYFGAILVLAGLLATLLGGIAGDRLRSRYPGSYFLVSGASTIIGFPFVLLVLQTPFPMAWVLMFLAIFCLFFNTGPANTIIANVTHPSVRASAFALNIFVIHALGDAISPPVIGYIGRNYSWNTAFGVVSVMMLVGGILWLWGARYLAEDTARAPERLG